MFDIFSIMFVAIPSITLYATSITLYTPAITLYTTSISFNIPFITIPPFLPPLESSVTCSKVNATSRTW